MYRGWDKATLGVRGRADKQRATVNDDVARSSVRVVRLTNRTVKILAGDPRV